MNNFDKLEAGQWYLQRDGEVKKVTKIERDLGVLVDGSLRLMNGQYKALSESDKDLIVHLEPIIPTAMPNTTREVVNFHAWSNDYGVLQWREENKTDGMQDWSRVESQDKYNVVIKRRKK